MSDKGTVALAYSGGLDTSVILKWLIEEGYRVIACIADVGQKEDFAAAREKALKVGAAKVFVGDLKERFVTDYIFPTFRANAVYENRYLLGTSVARPLIAAWQVEMAEAEGAQFMAHGATGKGNDQVRFELTYHSLKPGCTVLAPWKTPEFLARFRGRSDMLDYAAQHGIPVTASRAKPYSEDDNLLHLSHEAGILEDPSAIVEESVYSRTTAPELAPDKPELIRLTFAHGRPVHLVAPDSGIEETEPLKLFQALNALGSKHGIGRMDMVENRFVGIKSRGVYETPGGAILQPALRDLEGLTLDREVLRLRDSLSPKIAELVYYGFWYSPEMAILLRTIADITQDVEGEVTMRLYKGVAMAVARRSANSLYDPKASSMDEVGGFNQEDSAGFIRINAVRLIAAARRRQRHEAAR